MHQDDVGRRDHEQALIRIRATGIALGMTLLVLSPRADQTAAGAALIGYAAVVALARLARPRITAFRGVMVGMDILYAAAISIVLPATAGSWALYAFAIGAAGLGSGPVGAAAATGAAVAAYDAGIALRLHDLHAIDLWPVQLILAMGLLVAETAWAASRSDLTRRRLRTFALVQRDLIAAQNEPELLGRLTDHAVRTFGAEGAWVEVGTDRGRSTRHVRGRTDPVVPPGALARSWQLADAPPTWVCCTFVDARAAASAGPAIRDLVSDGAPLLVAARERARLAHAAASLERALAAARALERDRVVAAVFADVLEAATAIAGPAALVRPSDGTIVAGDLAATAALALVRDTSPPAIVRDRTGAPTGLVVAAGAGLVLVATEVVRELTADDLRALATLCDIAAAAVERIVERDGLVERGTALERAMTELGGRLRERDDAMASAVHELRTPLTSVHAYAQLTSRNLQSVQQQVKRLDRLIADLLRPAGGQRDELVLEDVDLLTGAQQAGRRITLLHDRAVTVQARGAGPFLVRADRSRIEQVLENLLGNAVKFSAPDGAIDVEVDRGTDEVIISVTDAGPGIPADELERVFERHYRGAQQRDTVPGEGIGLAISREIVVAHGGRIWGSSEGPGKGSTFFVALPALPAATVAAGTQDSGTLHRAGA